MKLLALSAIISACAAQETCTDQSPSMCSKKFAPENWRTGCEEMPLCVVNLKNSCCQSCKNFANLYMEYKQASWPACQDAAAKLGQDQYDRIVSEILDY